MIILIAINILLNITVIHHDILSINANFFICMPFFSFTANKPINIYDKAIQAIRRNIGVLWPELARALQFDHTDIDAIRVGPDRDNLNGQIFKMIRQWEQRHDNDKGTVHELLCGLRTAVNSTGDARLKEIRDRIFTDILIGKCIGIYVI